MFKTPPAPYIRSVPVALALLVLLTLAAPARGAGLRLDSLHPGAREFLVQPGERAVLQGYALGDLEAYIYPFQILRDYRVAILGTRGRSIPLSSLPLHTAVTPESIERTYFGNGFTLTEHWFVPHDLAGVVLSYRLRGTRTLTLEVSFRPVLDLMWPGAIGGQSSAWNGTLRAFVISEPSGRYRAYIGCPRAQARDASATLARAAFNLRLTTSRPSAEVLMSLDLRGHYDGLATYREMAKDWRAVQRRDERRLNERLASLAVLDTPDAAANRAFRWAEIALEQSWACNPELGCGLLAGYGPTRGVRRPQYEWFFGGDGLDAVRGLDAVGDEPRVVAEFDFLRRYQNPRTGMVWHELSQSAGLIDWSRYPYEYLHPDISMDYVTTAARVWRTRADRAWLRAIWPSLKSAYRYIGSLRDPKSGIPLIAPGKRGENEQLALRDELSLSLNMLAAEKSYAVLADAMEDETAARDALTHARTLQASIGRRYWNRKDEFVVQGFQPDGRPTPQQRPPIAALDSPAFTAAQQQVLIERLLQPDFLTSWGVRSLPSTDAAYDPTAYASGSVWPAADAAFAISLWRHHRDAAALHLWQTLVAASDRSAPGHIAEVFSGRAFRALDVAVPAQTFSSAGFLTATVGGLLGYDPDAAAGKLRLSPHLPRKWTRMGARRLPFADDPVDLEVLRQARRTSVELSLEHPREGTGWTVTLPAICPPSLLRATVDGRETTPETTTSRGHEEVTVRGRFGAGRTVRVALSCRASNSSATSP
ncbi:MAG TPA: hypothetical protein VJ738_21050 [Steroidobacteraceae bacterium]|nr:hypothetical protein [Steroidobacteraceae bacterium]